MANTYSKNTAKIDSAQKQIMNVVNVDKKKKTCMLLMKLNF